MRIGFIGTGIVMAALITACGDAPVGGLGPDKSSEGDWGDVSAPASDETKEKLGVDKWEANKDETTVKGLDANGDPVVEVKHEEELGPGGVITHILTVIQGISKAVSKFIFGTDDGGNPMLTLISDFLSGATGGGGDGNGNGTGVGGLAGLFNPNMIMGLMQGDLFKQGQGLFPQLGQNQNSNNSNLVSGDLPGLVNSNSACKCPSTQDANIVRDGVTCSAIAGEGTTQIPCGNSSLACPSVVDSCTGLPVVSVPYPQGL